MVQRHRARRLHYDLRLELDGVLVSWAVPQGPTLDPSVRRLAVKVEDHPIEYADFEGVIPSGEYGGGDVIVWDSRPVESRPGRWIPAKAIVKGDLHFDVESEKLSGRFVLVRTPKGNGRGKEQWLLIHKHDEHAVAGWDPEEHPESVKSAAAPTTTSPRPRIAPWHSDRPAAEAEVSVAAATDAPTDELAGPTERGAGGAGDPRRKGRWTLGGHHLSLTNLDKVLFPAATGRAGPVTKRDLIRYGARHRAHHPPLPRRPAG